MIKVVSFDLDGTLVDAGYGDAVWNHGIPYEYAKMYGIGFDEAKTLTRSQYESVGDNDLLWYDIDYWLRRFGLHVTAAELLQRYESQIELAPFAEEILKELAGAYTLVIASNAAQVFVEKELGYTGLRPFFSRVVSATSDYGLVKKDSAFYLKLCEALEIEPHEMIHTGDHAVFDHDVPLSVGIRSYHVTGEPGTEVQSGSFRNGRSTIRSLKELLDKL